ncbi:MAG: tetratricopeptide repeat protein [Desulfomonilaceae bacterium]
MKKVYFVGILICTFVAYCCSSWAETAQELHAKGEDAYKAQKYKQAVEYYTEALKIEPERHETIYCRGVNYHKLGEWDKALTDFEKLTSVKGIDHHAWHHIGLIHLGEWELNEAKGKHKEARGNLRETIGAFKKAFELEPSHVEYSLCIARAAVKLKDWDTATTFYERAHKLAPGNSEAGKGIRQTIQAAQDALKYYKSLGFPLSIENDFAGLSRFLADCSKRNIGADQAIEFLSSHGIEYWKKFPGPGNQLTVVLYKVPDRPELVLALAFDDNNKIRRVAAGPLHKKTLK